MTKPYLTALADTPQEPEFPEGAKFRISHVPKSGLFMLEQFFDEGACTPWWGTIRSFPSYADAEMHIHALVSPWPIYFDENGEEL